MKSKKHIPFMMMGVLLVSAAIIGFNRVKADSAKQAVDITEETNTIASNHDTVIFNELEGIELVSIDVMEEVLATAVADGTITQETADTLQTRLNEALPNTSVLHEEFMGEFTEEIIVNSDGVAFSAFHHHPFGMYKLLHQAQIEGVLTEEDLQAILEDLSNLAGEGVTITYAEGQMEMTLEDVETDLRDAFFTALDNAVANDRLTAEQAEKLKADVPEELSLNHPMMGNVVSIESFASDPSIMFGMDDGIIEFDEEIISEEMLDVSDFVSTAVESALTENRLTAEEAETLQSLLDKLFDTE